MVHFTFFIVQVVRAFGSSNGSGTDRLDSPQRVAVDVFGYALALDRNNDRVVLLNANLAYVRDVVNRTAIKQPRRMCLDAASGRLYVGLLDGRVVVFHVISVTSPTPPPPPAAGLQTAFQ